MPSSVLLSVTVRDDIYGGTTKKLAIYLSSVGTLLGSILTVSEKQENKTRYSAMGSYTDSSRLEQVRPGNSTAGHSSSSRQALKEQGALFSAER